MYKKFLKGDPILICSDGLTNMVPEEDIKRILQETDEPAKALIRAANNNGGMDNITVIVIRK